MKVMLDHNMSPRIARAIHELVQAAGDQCIALRARFPQDTPDTEWIADLSQEGGWTVFTLDSKISRRPHEKRALQESRVCVVFLAAGFAKKDPIEQAWRILKAWPAVRDQVEATSPPATFRLTANGKLER